MRMTLAASLVALISLTGCSGTTGDNTPTRSASAGSQSAGREDVQRVDVTIEGTKITPNGERIKVKTGQTITLHITSDRDGELHVHSTPEQELPFKKGDSTVSLSIDKPGIVDVEEHVDGVVVLQLEVS